MVASGTSRRERTRDLLLFLVACLLAGGSREVVAGCAGLVPSATDGAERPSRPITAEDLLALRDIGQPDGAMFGQPSPLAVSPDGRQAAFILTRADPDTNSYCRALVAISLDGPSSPRLLDSGGELITNVVTIRGLRIDSGFPAIVTPVWSPDGRRIAYLRREKGISQVRQVDVDGGGGVTLTRSLADVVDLTWNSTGSHILFATQPDLEAVRQKIAGEGRTGWLYDDRFVPTYGLRPQLSGPAQTVLSAVEPSSGKVRPATGSERGEFDARARLRSSATPVAMAADGRRAWTERSTDRLFAPLTLMVDGPDGQPMTCGSAACSGGFTGLWWTADGSELRFLRREGWANGMLGLYRWRPGQGEPERLMQTADVLLGCTPAGPRLLCTSENSVTPRHLVLLDFATGQLSPRFDPNPEFRALRLGKVSRIAWRNNRGLEAWGDLVLPPGHDGRVRLPLIVVQYTSLGFLRGGTGDEYPVYPLAAQGFAVLSLHQPDFVAAFLPDIRTVDDVLRANTRDWAERWSLLSSLETGVDRAIATGVIDPQRIGLTGLSDGATTARFALINSNRFAAASISSCCLDPQTVAIYTGPAFARQMRASGFPPPGDNAPEFWSPLSLARNARTVDRPLLMQLADSEALIGLESFTALKEAGQPVELYIFPDERHVKWQPAHRLAIYRRNIDWFRFWLQGKVDPEPAKAEQYRRWRLMGGRRTGHAPD